jgi:four helix bundle suffix protein
MGRGAANKSHGTNTTHSTYEATFKPLMETRPAEIAANIIICLINQANYLLDRQIKQLEQAFLKEGGLRERMTRARLDERGKNRR